MFYKVTLTSSGGLDANHIGVLVEYFKQCRHVYLVNEMGSSGANSHIEGIVEFDTVTTSNVTDRVKKVYKKIGLEVGEFTIKVRQATHLVGALIYASKELRLKGKVVLLRGWEQSWIDKQVKDNVKNIPHSMLKKKGTRVSQGTGAALVYEWCSANNTQVQCKRDYLEVVKSMAERGFLFGNTRHSGLYSDVCSLFGCGRACQSIAESDLRFID